MSWVYILRLNNGKYYTGSTTNLEGRINSHSEGKSGYTSKYLPVKLVFSKKFPDYRSARKAEIFLKKMKSKKFIDKIVRENKLY